MAHGGPDWGGSTPSDTTHPSADIGELAVRLGSPDALERLGNVILINTFAHGLDANYTNVSGASSYVELSTKYNRGDGWAMHLVADGSADAYARISQITPFPIAGILGVEFDASLNVLTQYVWIECDVYVGQLLYQAVVRYVFATHKLEYYDSAGNWQTLATGVYPYPIPYIFHCWKLVINVATGKYERFILDDITYPMTQAIKQTNTGADQNVVAAHFHNYSQLGSASESYVDCALITINEP